MNQVNLEDKVVLLTGGAGGLGRSLADLVLHRGGKVFLVDQDLEQLNKVREGLVKQHGVDRTGVKQVDVRSKGEWGLVWTDCEELLGTPTILVNIAGVKGEQDWETVYDTNLKGVHLGLETAMDRLSKEKGGPGGIVLNLSAQCGVTCQGGGFTTPAYTASKHAVTALTRTFGHKFWYERTGVSVVAVSPSPTSTPFLSDWSDWTPDLAAQQELASRSQSVRLLSAEEAALKMYNVLGSRSGEVWLVRPGMLPPFSVPDYTLPRQKIV